MPGRVLRTGDRLGPFTLDRRIAVGGMAEVWTTERPPRGAPVALKVMLPTLASDPEFRVMFRDEVRLARRLKHPNIIRIHHAYEVGDTAFLAMELIEGIDLRRLLLRLSQAGQWMPVPLVLAVGRSLARALDYAHNLGNEVGQPLRIVHRDVSPHNVMLARDGRIKLLDFGIARAAERLTRTQTGVVKGKLAYMAPEQALATKVGPAADIFATGVVLWETLAMQRLFRGRDDADTLEKVLQAEIRPVRDANPVVPRPAAALVHRMLERNAEARPRSMADVEISITAILSAVYSERIWSRSAMRTWLAPYLGPPGGPVRNPTQRLEEATVKISGPETRAESAPASLAEARGEGTPRVSVAGAPTERWRCAGDEDTAS